MKYDCSVKNYCVKPGDQNSAITMQKRRDPVQPMDEATCGRLSPALKSAQFIPEDLPNCGVFSS